MAHLMYFARNSLEIQMLAGKITDQWKGILDLYKTDFNECHGLCRYRLVLGWTQFVGLEFGIFGGFGWVHSLVLVGEPGFRRVQSSDLGFGKPNFWLTWFFSRHYNRVKTNGNFYMWYIFAGP